MVDYVRLKREKQEGTKRSSSKMNGLVERSKYTWEKWRFLNRALVIKWVAEVYVRAETRKEEARRSINIWSKVNGLVEKS